MSPRSNLLNSAYCPSGKSSRRTWIWMSPEPSRRCAKAALPMRRRVIIRPAMATATGSCSSASAHVSANRACRSPACASGRKSFGYAWPRARNSASFARRCADCSPLSSLNGDFPPSRSLVCRIGSRFANPTCASSRAALHCIDGASLSPRPRSPHPPSSIRLWVERSTPARVSDSLLGLPPRTPDSSPSRAPVSDSCLGLRLRPPP